MAYFGAWDFLIVETETQLYSFIIIGFHRTQELWPYAIASYYFYWVPKIFI